MTAVEYSFNTSGCGVGEVFSKNPLHSVVQSAVDGKRQRLETFRNKLVDARRRGFHFEQVRSRTSLDGKVVSVTKKVSTDGQTAFRLYIVLANVPALSCRSR